MQRTHTYHGTRAELLRELSEAQSVVNSTKPLHEDPLEDVAIRGIWSALHDTLLQQLETIDPKLASQHAQQSVNSNIA